MRYPSIPDFGRITGQITEYARLAAERGNPTAQALLNDVETYLSDALAAIKRLPQSDENRANEPDDYNAILALRPDGPRRLWHGVEPVFADRLAGAFLGRMAGCTLGAPVEFWTVEAMREWAGHIGDAFPPVNYWSRVPYPYRKRYTLSPCAAYTRDGLDGVPVDDDIVYTLLGLLIAEDHGIHFSVNDVGASWLKYLPLACTAEDVALKALKRGVPAALAGETDNPYCQWIGADIRSDPFAYMAPGYPELAARMAYNDAYISHRQNGIYGEMFFAAAISAAFATGDAMEALRIGLTEIPANCALANDVRWALDAAQGINGYEDARAAVDERFDGMSGVHTNNNACLTIFGVAVGNGDFTRTIGETVAMGMDNDCTAATAGSLLGAAIGARGIPEHWTDGFNNTVHSYFYGNPSFSIADLISRFYAQAELAHKS